MTNQQLQNRNQALQALLHDCVNAFEGIEGAHEPDRLVCIEMRQRIKAELDCQQTEQCASQPASTLSNEEQEAFTDWYPLGCPGAGVTAELSSRAGFHAGAAWQRAKDARAAKPEHAPAFELDAEAGLEEWAKDKFRHGRFVAPLYGNTDWALARKVWSAALEFASAHYAQCPALSTVQGLEQGDKTYLVVDPADNFHICYTVKSRELALSYADGGLVAFGPIEDIAQQQALPSDDELARAAFERAHPAPQGVTFDSVLKQYMCGASGSLQDRDAYQKLWKDWQAGAATQPATVPVEQLSRLFDFTRFVLKCVRLNGEYAPLSMREPHEIEALLAGLCAPCIVSAEQPAAQTAPAQYGRYETQAGESLAGIALRQLGDESRWVEIRNLNAEAFPDMERHEYYPVGTVLKMPVAHGAQLAKGEAKRQLQLLGQALGDCIAAAGIIRPDVSLSGPELLMLAEDLKRQLALQTGPAPEPDMIVRVRNRNDEVMPAEEVATSAWFDSLPDGTVVELYRRAVQIEQQPAIETLIRQLAAVRKQRDALMRQLSAGSTGKFRMGDSVRKTSGSEWAGLIVGWYSTENNPEGYAVESEAHKGSVQIYPAHALTAQGDSDE